jgi:hypothetical protein
MPDDTGDAAPQHWGAGEASTPSTVKIITGFGSGEGHPGTIRDIFSRQGLYVLIGNMWLAFVAVLMLAIAAWAVVNAPSYAITAVSFIALPACVMAFGLAGFAAFRIRKMPSGGIEISGGPAPQPKAARYPKPVASGAISPPASRPTGGPAGSGR